MAADIALYRDLGAVERDAGDALSRVAQPWMFDRLEWFRLVVQHTLHGTPLVLKASREGASCWIFLAQVGSSAEALTNWYCLRYGAVTCRANGVQPPFEDLVDGLRQAGVSHLFMEPIATDDPLPAALRQKRWLVKTEQVNVSWRIDTRGMRFDDYWATRPSKLRNTAKRKAKLASLDLVVFKGFDAVAWGDLEEVFAASWKKPEGSPLLIRDIAAQEGEAGTLRLGLAYKDGQAVAAQIWTIEHGVATIHKLAYREDAKELSAGTVLSVEMFRRALDDDKVDLIDFGIGNDAYKRDWMDYSVPLYALSAYYPYDIRGLIGLAKAVLRKIFSSPDRTREARYGRPR